MSRADPLTYLALAYGVTALLLALELLALWRHARRTRRPPREGRP